MSTHPLIDAAVLTGIIDDPAVRIADTRWYLGEPERGQRGYDKGHLPGAVFVELDRDLTAASGPGRHPLADRAAFAATMGRLGVGDAHRIVVYDDRSGVIAARLWWMLRDLGHEAVQVLDGGLAAWTAAGYQLTMDRPQITPAVMTVRPTLTRQIDRDALRHRLGTVTVLDARAPDRYRGEVEPIDPVAGHIPTALSAPTTDNLDDSGYFRSAAALVDHYLRLAPQGEVVASCGSGVFACHDILAMRVAGLPEPILYPGSWSDWSSSGLPAAVGNEPGALAE